MGYQVFAQDVTIANGSSTSGVIPINGLMLVGVATPSNIAGARLGIQVRVNGSDTFRTLRNVGGVVYTTIAGNTVAVFAPDITRLLSDFDAIRLVTMDNSNAAVNQTSDVTIRVFLSPI